MKKLFRVGRQKPKVQVEPLQRLTPRRKAPIYLLESEPIYLQEAPIYLQDAAPLQFSANEGRGAFDQTVVVGSLLTFVVNACDHRSLAGRNAHEVAHLRQVLDGYLASTTSDDVVHAIIQSLEIRKVLLDIVSKLGLAADPNLRAAQRSDSERIATLLAASFKSEDDKNTILNLSGDSAQSFLDVIQESLDKGLLLDAEQSRMARSMIRKLSESCDSLPSSLFIPNGVHACEQYPTFGGGFGDIYRAIMHDKPVALKRMRHFLRGSDLRRIHLKFCREALIWKELQNPYILPLIGIDRDSFPSSLCMVSPWMEQGTAISYLKEHGHATVDKLLLEIARGLEYLHSRNIIHGDLKGANILIQGNGTACLADFGLSNFSDVTTSMSTNRGGSVYWMAPELLDPDQFEFEFTRTPATDVYAFGCVCFELYTGRPPFANLRDGVAAIKVIMGERAVRPSGLPAMSDLLWQHVTLYWAHSPTTRPTTLQVVQNMCLHIPSPQPRTEGLNYSLNTRIQGQLSQRHPVVVDGDVEEFFGIGDRPNPQLSPKHGPFQPRPDTGEDGDLANHDGGDREPDRDFKEECNDLTLKIALCTADAAWADWTLILDICDAVSLEARAAAAVRKLRHAFKYGEPAAHLAAARLWGILLRHSSEIFINQFTYRPFLDTLEDFLASSYTAPVVRQRIMDLLAATAYASDSKNNAGFRDLWRRVKPRDKPEEGMPLDTEDAMFNPPLPEEAVRAVRHKFKYGEPAAQLAAARLWDILLRNSSEIFVNEFTSSKFLDTVEDLLTSSRTAPFVRDRVMGVLAAAASASGSKTDASFRSLWQRVKQGDKPEEIPFDIKDPTFNPFLLAAPSVTPIIDPDATAIAPPPPQQHRPSDNHSGAKNDSKPRQSHRHQIIPPDEDMRRLFQECKFGVANAKLLTQALVAATPDRMDDFLIVEFRNKCVKSQELIFTQIPWASAGAERSRAAKHQDERERARTRKTSVTSITPHNGSLPDLSQGAATQTREEELLADLLASNELLMEALRLHDNLKRKWDKRVPPDENTRRLFEDCKTAAGHANMLIQELLTMKPLEHLHSAVIVDSIQELRKKCMQSRQYISSRLSMVSAYNQWNDPPSPTDPDLPLDLQSTWEKKLRGDLLAAHKLLIKALELYDYRKRTELEREAVKSAPSALHHESPSHDLVPEDEEWQRDQLSVKVGKRRALSPDWYAEDEDGGMPGSDAENIVDASDDEGETMSKKMWAARMRPAPQYVYDAVAERTQARVRLGRVSPLTVNGVH